MEAAKSLLNNRAVNLGIRAGLLAGTVMLFGYVGVSGKIFNPFSENKVERVYYAKPDYANKSIIFYERDIPHTVREV